MWAIRVVGAAKKTGEAKLASDSAESEAKSANAVGIDALCGGSGAATEPRIPTFGAASRQQSPQGIAHCGTFWAHIGAISFPMQTRAARGEKELSSAKNAAKIQVLALKNCITGLKRYAAPLSVPIVERRGQFDRPEKSFGFNAAPTTNRPRTAPPPVPFPSRFGSGRDVGEAFAWRRGARFRHALRPRFG